MTYNFKEQLVSAGVQRAKTYGGTNGRLYIAVHMTGNTRKGADAPAHANLQSRGNSRQASWHEQIDDKVVIQSFPHTAQCWHSGKGRDRGNLNAIALELCVNSDGDYGKMIENAVARIRDLMAMYNIPLSNVIQHHDLSGKNCPRELRQGKHGITWNSFLSMIAGQSVTVPSKPKPTPKPSGKIAEDGFWGRATTRALQRYFKTPEDGEVWHQNRKWRKANPGLTHGWKWVVWNPRSKGSPVIRAMQGVLRVTEDGRIGPETINKLSARYGIRGDGKLDAPSITIKAMQKALNEGKF